MRSRIVPQRDIRERFGAEVKPFAPAFVIPRRYPGWEETEPGCDPAAAAPGTNPLPRKTPRYIVIDPRA